MKGSGLSNCQWTTLMIFWMNTCIVFFCVVRSEGDYQTSPQDGWFNNLIHPDWGAIDGQLLRTSPVAYSDGTYMPSGQNRPNPFRISFAGHHGKPGLGSLRNRTVFMVFFGQQVVEEIVDAQRAGCPREFFNIKVQPDIKNPDFDPEGKGNIEMPVFRTRYDKRTGLSPNNPRQQLNEITPFIDGGLVYGPGKAWTNAIREFSEEYPGRLKAQNVKGPIKNSFPAENDIRLPFANPPPPREHELKPVKRFWRIGNSRGNDNPFLLAFGVLWFRYHNYVADEIHKQHPALNDEQVFNRARRWVIAVYQKIVFYDWLPRWLCMSKDGTKMVMPPYYTNTSDSSIMSNDTTCKIDPALYNRYNGYNPHLHPGISQESQTSALRFGHTLVTPGTWIRDKNCTFKMLPLKTPGSNGQSVHALRLCNAFWNPQGFLTSSPDAYDNLLMGLATARCEREDHIVVPDLREHVFGPLGFSRRDLVALNIQRARDHGLPGYNEVRKAYGLETKKSWEEINDYNVTDDDFPHPDDQYLFNYTGNKYMFEPIQRLKALYGNTSAPDDLDLFSGGLLETTPDGPGELFRTIILDQFLRIRHGDRFWFENKGLFEEDEMKNITATTILDILSSVTNIDPLDVNYDPFQLKANGTCFQPEQLKADSDAVSPKDNLPIIENCTRVQHYDYFSGSEVSFALSFLALALCIPATVGVMILMARYKQKTVCETRKQLPRDVTSNDHNEHLAVEWVGPKEGERNIRLKFDNKRKKLHVTDRRRKPLRMIDLRMTEKVHTRLSTDKGCTLCSVRVPGEIDLVLRFAGQPERYEFIEGLVEFLQQIGVETTPHSMKEDMVLQDATTKEKRQKVLDKFFRVVCLQAFESDEVDMPDFDAETANEVSKIQLTRTEFADSLGLKPTSMFVRNMFLLVDKDRNGFVSFTEFMELFTILAKGNAHQKAALLFNMHDLRGKGEISKENFNKMIKSMLDLSDTNLDSSDLQTLVDMLYGKVGLSGNQPMTLAAFEKIFASDEYEKTLEQATFALQGQGKGNKIAESFIMRRKTFIASYGEDVTPNGTSTRERPKSHIQVSTSKQKPHKTGWQNKLYTFNKWVENYKRQIFWVTLYILVCIGIFVERAFYYSLEREHVGLRRLAGYGVTVTRGAASGMMFTYSCLLLTMSRNTITYLRETFLHRFIPFDSFHAMHKLIAWLALLFTVIHCIGHGINLYHISTWASEDLNCVFREYFRATDQLASFHYWAWTTITGLTGIILTIIVIIMYVFAMPYSRRYLFRAFWITHGFYILLYLFMLLHGSGRLVQSPLTQNFLIGPLVVYVIDKLISYSRKKVEISVQKAELLPSDVLGLTFRRPLNFEYKSGQWVRIACLELGVSEYHPFTLTSAPHEEHLILHIRAVGPWTMNMRKIYDANNRDGKKFPKLYLDGPFGEGHQDWYMYKVAVLVGGGIGVTPFASILKDIVFKAKNSTVRFPCEKVYFLWVTRTQKHFEWLTDIIREVEANDQKRFVDIHIFITQFQQKFDLRTTMLYICERQFQRISGKSLFTGLRATTHFGRPEFESFFKSLHLEHPKVKQVGVFSCGPPPMTSNVDRACGAMNKFENLPTFSHHFENF